MVKAVAVFLFLKQNLMCLVVVNGETKKSCCNCGGLCKREQKWAEKLNRIPTMNETDNAPVTLQDAQLLQPRKGLVNVAKHYEKGYHL